MIELVNHVNNEHDYDMEIQTETFDNYENFEHWKKDLETSTRSWFVKHRGDRESKGYTTAWYYCNLTGQYETEGKGKRSLKIQGTSKISAHCTAFIRTQTDNLSGIVSVDYCSHHIGHDDKLGHIRMTDEIRSKIAGELAKGVKIEEILNEIRNDMEKPLCRDKLVTRKDVHNVKHQFNVELLQKHPNDAQSVLC